MEAALWSYSSNKFTADQEMEIRVRWHMVHRQKTSDDPNDDVITRVRKNVAGNTSTVNQDEDTPNIHWTGCGYSGNCGTGSGNQNWIGYNAKGWSSWFNLNAGDTVWMESQKKTASDSSMYQCGYNYYGNSCVSPWEMVYFEFDVKASGGLVANKDLHDAKIDHHVQRLGFDLQDIQIPQSIADKIQGK